MNEPTTIIEPSLIIRVNQLYHPGMNELELYEITRGVWRVANRRNFVEFAFCVYKGIIKEVYAVNSWYPALTLPYETRIEADITLNGKISMHNRWEFKGELAHKDIRSKYIGKSVEHYFKKGAANPVTYMNC